MFKKNSKWKNFVETMFRKRNVRETMSYLLNKNMN